MEVNTELHGEDAQSRFQLLEKPVAFPGSCGVCGAVDRPVLDFGAEVEIEGRGFGAFYLCITCVIQAYSKIPLPPEEAVVHTDETEIQNIKVELADVVTDAIDRWIRSTEPDDSGSDILRSGSADEGSKSGTDTTADEADESVSKPRSANLPNLNSSGLAAGLGFDL